MKALFLNREEIEKIEARDPIFGRKVAESRRGIINFIRQSPVFLNTLASQMQSGDLYRARIPASVLKGLQEHKFEKVLKNKSKLWTGMIRRADHGKTFASHAEWEKMKFDPVILSNLINQMALQASIAEITEKLLIIDRKLDLVISGQHGDRLSLIHSGIEQYETASLCKNNQRRNNQLDHAIRSLNEGRSKLITAIKTMQESHKARKPDATDKLWRLVGVDSVKRK